MKHLKLFFALFAMLALGVGNAWAEEATFGDDWNAVFGTSHSGSISGIKANQLTLSGVVNQVSLSATNGTSTNGYVKTSDWRLYNGYTLTITAPSNHNITAITAKKGGKIISGISTTMGTLTIPSDGETMSWTGNTNQVVFSITATMGFSEITVTYSTDGSSTPNPEPEPGTGGDALSYTWDLSTESYSAESAEQVTWSATDVNMVLTKETSSTNADNYLGGTNAHTRVYKNQKITFNPGSDVTITSIEITATSSTYAGYFRDATWSNGSAELSNTIVTITPTNGANAISCTIGTATRATGVTVHYTKNGGTEETALSVEPKEVAFGTKNIYFDSEKKGSLEIEITGQNLTGDVTAAISGTDATVFDLSQESFTPEDGEVSEKLTVSYEVSEEKEYSATLTLSSDGVEAIELPITLTTVNKKPTVYTKVTDAATLSAGDKVIFVYEVGKKAAGKLSSGYLASIDIAQAINTIANPAIVSITDEAVIEYTLGGTTGAWELISASGKLSEASANSSSSVDLALDKGTKWTISISSGNATIKGTTNTIKYNTSFPRFKTYDSEQTAIQLYAISVPKYAVNFIQPEGGELIVKNGETAITSGNTFAEGIKLTVTATPANGYEGGTVVVKDADGNDVTATVYADGVLTMPAYAVTISATFEKKPCELLAKPVVTAETTYSSAKLTWEAVTNAAKYSVKIGEGEAIETTDLSYNVTGLNAETTYTYQVQAIAEAEQDIYCDSEVAEGTFKTATAPTATLTLSDIEGTTTKTGALNGTITLPTEAAECSKTFVGWDADENCDHAPTYAPGAEYTFTTVDPTLYAVYADGEAGEALQWTIKDDDLKVLDASQSSGYAKYAGDQEKDGVTFNITSVMPATGENAGKIQMQAEKATIYNKTAMPGNIISIAIDGVDLSVYEGTEVISSTPSSGAITKNGEVYNFSSGKRYFHLKKSTKSAGYANSITVTYASAPTYSNYSTTCAAALEKPTFSVAEGTYTEAKYIELNATEGDIYYTLDGTDPTASSTQYTTAIVLDECGTTTIKAIAISADSQSPVANATYTINLPITNTAATAYTPAEAIAIIDGECDKTEEVFVKGVVVSTSAFSAEYGNYDVIVKAVDDNSAAPTTFTFYRMYKAADKTKFTASDDVIGVGDIITAKGKLTKYNSTYELAEGCYMIEREAFTEPKTDISNTLETAYTVDKAFELISDVKSDLDNEVYVKGFVAVASTQLYNEKYLTYSISDNGQATGNVLKVYDGLDIGGVAFTSKDDVKVGDYVVVKGKLLNYGGTYEINKDNQLVQHVKAATITIANITMEVDEVATISATVDPAEAEVTYTIKENAANAISLSGNTITALAEGTATITATVADGATYMGNSVDFTVNVGPKTVSDEVVILAELDGKWYAMKGAVPSGKSNQLDAIEVTYFNGTLYNVAESDKASITWTRSIVDGKATFVNNGKYLKGDTDTDLTLSTSVDDKCKWMWDDENGYYTTNTSGTIRTFLYRNGYNFKNYGVSQAGKEDANGNYSELPVVTAPVYATGDITYTRNVTNKYGTICLPYASASTFGAYFYRVVGKETGKVYLESVDALEAGVPYIFEKTANTITVTCQGEAVAEAGSANGLVGNFTNEFIVPADNYILLNNELRPSDGSAKVNAYRAYLNMNAVTGGAPTQMPGRRYIGMSVQGENEATGFENITAPTGKTIKAIVNGQLIIIRDGEMYNAQGQRL